MDVYAYYVESTPVSFETRTPTLEEFRRRMSGILGEYPYLVCEAEGELAGFAYSHRHMERAAYRWNAELSVYLTGKFAGRGLGKALYRALIKISTRQGLRNLYGGVTLPNPASEGLHRSVGFRPCGVLAKTGYKSGSWHDVGWFELRLPEVDVDSAIAQPDEPLPFSALDAGMVREILRSEAERINW